MRWRFNTSGKISSSPAIGSDGTIYVGGEDHYLYAVTPQGELKWRFETDGGIVSSPTIGPDGTIYIGSQDHHLYAIRSESSGYQLGSPWPHFHYHRLPP